MCGILGIINKKNAVDPVKLESNLNRIAHRGPDSSGIVVEGNIGLGHRRLSIVDLSETGSQPMTSMDGNHTIIFNGEIYNHQLIRDELIRKGYRFRGTSDTETLLNGFIEYGTDVLEKLNGIYAFAVYDRNRSELVIARDQLGVKPLYYIDTPDAFAYSSELKALLHTDGFCRDIDHEALVNYINFLWCPGEKTPFLQVKKLLPGHYIRYNTRSHVREVRQFYDIPFGNNIIEGKNEQYFLDETEHLLVEATKRQLMSDVPVGFFVSGGIDSSLIAAIAAKHGDIGRLKAFTIDSGDRSGKEGFEDDLHYARLVSQKLGFDLEVVDSGISILDDFDKMIWHLDEPQSDPAPLSVYRISDLARKMGIKVLLGGTAADDLFSGYRRHQALVYSKWMNKIPSGIMEPIKRYTSTLESTRPFNRRLKKIMREYGKSEDDKLSGYFSWIPLEINKGLFSQDVKRQIAQYDPASELKHLLRQIPNEDHELNKLLYLEMKSFLVDHNLNYMDKMSMAVGVEARVPYLDLDLVNYSTRIPVDLKMKGTRTKYLLRKISEKYLPHEVIHRKKSGFGAPVRSWIVNDMNDYIHERLSPTRLKERGLFDPTNFWKMVEDNRSGKIDASYTIWSVLAIESWLTQFADQ